MNNHGMTVTVSVPVRDLHGNDMGVFTFSPSAISGKKYRELKKELPKINHRLSEISRINPDGTAPAGRDSELLEQAEREFCAAVDAIFGANASAVFFEHIRPFAAVGGKFWCSSVITQIEEYMKSYMATCRKQAANNCRQIFRGRRNRR